MMLYTKLITQQKLTARRQKYNNTSIAMTAGTASHVNQNCASSNSTAYIVACLCYAHCCQCNTFLFSHCCD